MDKLGWELVSALKDPDNSFTQFYFKREITSGRRVADSVRDSTDSIGSTNSQQIDAGKGG